ncbi:hypothetical protein AB6A40_007226 [Gnathostoma spinigerum]|uniref:Fucosyltransferase n=1 Tax=Gnathostoma spinigerum TaxID=75299 RepID=A0ABD6EMT1_9BILA
MERGLKDSNKEPTWQSVLKTMKLKTMAVLQLVSNCETRSRREQYVKVLSKYIPVTVLGECSKTQCNDSCAEHQLLIHRFYLAFENSICKDYVTEKFFRPLHKFSVPIVLKRSIMDGIAPNHSFIAVDDFTSPKKLAEYLHFLMKNDTEYLSYFEWTKKCIFDNYPGVKSTCRLCEMAHKTSMKTYVVKDVWNWMFNKSECDSGSFLSGFLNGNSS